jgi:hypothetical protein
MTLFTTTKDNVNRMLSLLNLMLIFYLLAVIQLCPLRPIPTVDPALCSAEVPNAVRSFYYVNEVDTFQSDRPFHQGPKDPGNEFKVGSTFP